MMLFSTRLVHSRLLHETPLHSEGLYFLGTCFGRSVDPHGALLQPWLKLNKKVIAVMASSR